jgi:hypothetical protein
MDSRDKRIRKFMTVIISLQEWWLPLFSYCLDLSVEQDRHLSRNTAQDHLLDLLAIIRDVT